MEVSNFLIAKANKTFLEEVQYEIKDLFRTFADFFAVIKEHTYDALCANFGPEIINLFFIALGAFLVMIICLKIINR